MTHHVRLPAQDRNLVIGYHHICDAEHYFSHQLAKIDSLPDDLKTVDLHQDLSKLLSGHIINAFCSPYYRALTEIHFRHGSYDLINLMPPVTDFLGFVLH